MQWQIAVPSSWPLKFFIPGITCVPVGWLVLGESVLNAGVLPVQKARLGALPLYLLAE